MGHLYPITAPAENTLISMGNTFSTCVFFESKTNGTSVQTDCTVLVSSMFLHVFVLNSEEFYLGQIQFFCTGLRLL